jgi:hypothetical protein
MRVLENQAKLAAERSAPAKQEPRDPQLRMPLIVEVRPGERANQPPRRPRRKAAIDQPDLGKL